MKRLRDILVKDKVQRLLYSIALLCWIVLFFPPLSGHYRNKLSIINLLIVLVPAALLFLQIFLNSKIIWALFLFFGGLDILNLISSFLTTLLKRNSISMDLLADMFIFIIAYLLCLLILVLIKPKHWLKPTRSHSSG